MQYLEDKIFNNSSTVPYNGPNSSLCFQVSEVQRQAGSQSPGSPTEKALQGSEKRDDIVIIEDHSSYCLDQQSSAFDQHYADQQMQKLARGRYKCSRCGALKVRLRFFLFEILSAFYRAVSSLKMCPRISLYWKKLLSYFIELIYASSILLHHFFLFFFCDFKNLLVYNFQLFWFLSVLCQV